MDTINKEQLFTEYNSVNAEIDIWDSEPDNPRKDAAIFELSNRRAEITFKLRDVFVCECYPEIGDTKFYQWLASEMDNFNGKCSDAASI